MATTITANLNLDVYMWLMEKTKNSPKGNLSSVVNFYLRSLMEKDMTNKEDVKKYTLTICPECGSEYSTKLNQCPNCADIEVKTFKKEEQDVETLYQKEQSERKYKLSILKDMVDPAEKRVEKARAAAKTSELTTESWTTSKERQELIDSEKEYENIINQIYQLENEVRGV